jgi:hypothetical protein
MRLPIALVAIVLLAPACSRKPAKRLVERVDLDLEAIAQNAVMAMTPSQVQAALEAALAASGAFQVLKQGSPVPAEVKPLKLKLAVEFAREATKEGRPGTWAEVGALLTVRGGPDPLARYELLGVGEVKVAGDSLDERQAALRKALELALAQAVESANLEVSAAEKSDEALVKDLADKDVRVQDFAVRALADRKNPAAALPLLERLKRPDEDQVRRAIGGLIELKDPRAVSPLIDLAREKNLMFLREVIFALGAIGGDEAEAYLYTVAQGHDQPAIRAAAQQALDELSARKTGKKEATSDTKGR